VSLCLSQSGNLLECPVYTREEVSFPDERMIPYKDYRAVYRDQGIGDVAAQCVVIGDFQRFSAKGGQFSGKFFRRFDFIEDPEVLRKNFSLCDHPLPVEGRLPVYMVVPSVHASNGESLDFSFALQLAEKMYHLGGMNASRGYDLLPEETKTFQRVRCHGPNPRGLFRPPTQRYLILKGRLYDWKPFIELNASVIPC
jgi:hypothetical protein